MFALRIGRTVFMGAKRKKTINVPKLYRVILPVKNIDRAAAFYAKVLGIPGERISGGRHYFKCGGTILACYSPKGDGDPVGKGWRFHPNQYVYFSVRNLIAAYRRVSNAGGKTLGGAATMPWGERMFWARDPFGNPISFVDERTLFRGSSR